MSLLKQYLIERGVKEIIEYDDRFVTFSIQGAFCCIHDMYIHPDSRGKSKSKKLADEVVKRAKEEKCKYLTASIDATAKDNVINFYTIYKYGFKLNGAENNQIFFIKDI